MPRISNMNITNNRKTPICKIIIAFFLLNFLVRPGLAETTYDIDYLDGSDYLNQKDRLDIFMPASFDPVPVIVYFHGGALRMGEKADAYVVASQLSTLGIGVVTPNYRLTPAVMHPAHIEDAAAATAWVMQNIEDYGGDPDSIYLAGHSAGAYLAILLALDAKYLQTHSLNSNSIRGSIAISPFLYVEETASDRPKDVWGIDPVQWLAASVSPHIEEGKSPMMLIYASGDDKWRKRQNKKFGKAMRALGNDVRVKQVPKRDHMSLISKLNADDDQITELILTFIAKQQ